MSSRLSDTPNLSPNPVTHQRRELRVRGLPSRTGPEVRESRLGDQARHGAQCGGYGNGHALQCCLQVVCGRLEDGAVVKRVLAEALLVHLRDQKQWDVKRNIYRRVDMVPSAFLCRKGRGGWTHKRQVNGDV